MPMTRRLARQWMVLGTSLAALASAAGARDLVGVYEDALKNDTQIHPAEAIRRASAEARPQAWSALLPQISGALTRTQDRQDGTEPSQDIGTGVGTPGSNPQGPVAPTGNTGAASSEFAVDSISKGWSLNL